MKNKLKEILIKLNNWKFTILKMIILGLIMTVIAGAFFWFQLRPAKIFTYCHERAQKSAIKEYSSYEGNTSFNPSDYELYYKQCLRLKGINK